MGFFCRGPDFRPKFQRLGELTCLHPDIAHVALTATAKPESITALAETLMLKNYTVVAVNPDRPNIYIDVRTRPLPSTFKRLFSRVSESSVSTH